MAVSLLVIKDAPTVIKYINEASFHNKSLNEVPCQLLSHNRFVTGELCLTRVHQNEHQTIAIKSEACKMFKGDGGVTYISGGSTGGSKGSGPPPWAADQSFFPNKFNKVRTVE